MTGKVPEMSQFVQQIEQIMDGSSFRLEHVAFGIGLVGAVLTVLSLVPRGEGRFLLSGMALAFFGLFSGAFLSYSRFQPYHEEASRLRQEMVMPTNGKFLFVLNKSSPETRVIQGEVSQTIEFRAECGDIYYLAPGNVGDIPELLKIRPGTVLAVPFDSLRPGGPNNRPVIPSPQPCSLYLKADGHVGINVP